MAVSSHLFSMHGLQKSEEFYSEVSMAYKAILTVRMFSLYEGIFEAVHSLYTSI
jgi:hypothetical protein